MDRDGRSFTARLKRFLVVSAAILAVAGAGGCAKAPKAYRVGILVGTDSMKSLSEGFRKRMAELGYLEGRNVVYDIRESNADREAERRIAEAFVAAKLDLVFAFPGQAALAVKTAAKAKVPIVFASAIIGGTDLVESVRNPGGTSPACASPTRNSPSSASRPSSN